MDFIKCENLVKIYKTKDFEVIALQGLDLEIQKGEMMAIIGSSGSGKSTLLNIIGGLDRPTAGTVIVGGRNLLEANDQELLAFKKTGIGFVWQNNARNLLPFLTARENIEVPLMLSGKNKKVRRKRADDLLSMVGLSHRAGNKLMQLSGGEQQRVAIGIAMANEPEILLADEPTGAVDTQTAEAILNVFRNLNQEGVTVIIVTHDLSLSRKVNRIVSIRDGLTSSEFLAHSSTGGTNVEARKIKSFAEESQEQNAQEESNQKQEEHNEFIVMDRIGRIQLPKDYVKNLSKNHKFKARVEGKILTLEAKE